jgi:hypothetical protein
MLVEETEGRGVNGLPEARFTGQLLSGPSSGREGAVGTCVSVMLQLDKRPKT